MKFTISAAALFLSMVSTFSTADEAGFTEDGFELGDTLVEIVAGLQTLAGNNETNPMGQYVPMEEKEGFEFQFRVGEFEDADISASGLIEADILVKSDDECIALFTLKLSDSMTEVIFEGMNTECEVTEDLVDEIVWDAEKAAAEEEAEHAAEEQNQVQ